MDEFLNNEKQMTLSDLIAKMAEVCSEQYSSVYMKKKLQEHFGDSLTIKQSSKNESLITIRKSAAKVLNDFHCNMLNRDFEAQKKNIIRTAASQNKADIDDIKEDRAMYPNLQGLGDIENNVLSSHFIKGLFKGKFSVPQ